MYSENEQLHLLFSDHNFFILFIFRKITIANKSLVYCVAFKVHYKDLLYKYQLKVESKMLYQNSIYQNSCMIINLELKMNAIIFRRCIAIH